MFFFGQFPYERKPRIKNICVFYTHTHTDSQLILVISMVAVMVGTVVCVASRHPSGVGGWRSLPDRSVMSSKAKLKYPSIIHSQGFLAEWDWNIFSEDLHE